MSGRRSWLPLQRDFLGDGEVVLLRLLPVDEVDGLGDLARLDLHRHAVAQQAVDGLVVAVEAAVVVVRLGAQLVEGRADLRRRVAALGQLGGEQVLLDVAVAVAVGPVAEVAVAQFIAEQGDDAVLRGAFGLADGAHTSRILPVSSSCIMPCLSCAGFGELGFQRGDLGVHVGEDGGDGGLFGEVGMEADNPR